MGLNYDHDIHAGKTTSRNLCNMQCANWYFFPVHFTGETATTYHFKTLVPSVAAGAIIGKGGETIASLQKDAGARVKMSKSHDFYPGRQTK